MNTRSGQSRPREYADRSDGEAEVKLEASKLARTNIDSSGKKSSRSLYQSPEFGIHC